MMKPIYFYGLFCLFSFYSCAYFSHNKDKDIPKSLDKAVSFLKDIQRKDGAICDTINPLFDTWETVLAVEALEAWKDTPNIALNKALAYLFLNENKDGLLCHNQKCKAAYCLETTSQYLLFLNRMNDSLKMRERINKIKTWQKTEGNWAVGNPDVLEQKEFPSVTGFALALMEEEDSICFRKGINWLIAQQNEEGNWGYAWEYYDCPAYALWANLRALATFPDSLAEVAREKAHLYIIKSQEKDGSWNFKGSSIARKPSPELQTALMLSALEYTNRLSDDSITLRGINFLLSHQQANGSWDGGYFPIDNQRYVKKEYVFATTRAMMVLRNYLVNVVWDEQ